MTPGNETSENRVTWAAIIVALFPVLLAALDQYRVPSGGLGDGTGSEWEVVVGAFLAVFAAVVYTVSRTALKAQQTPPPEPPSEE